MTQYFLEQALEQKRLDRRSLVTKSILPHPSHVVMVAPLGVDICCRSFDIAGGCTVGVGCCSICNFFTVNKWGGTMGEMSQPSFQESSQAGKERGRAVREFRSRKNKRRKRKLETNKQKNGEVKKRRN